MRKFFGVVLAAVTLAGCGSETNAGGSGSSAASAKPAASGAAQSSGKAAASAKPTADTAAGEEKSIKGLKLKLPEGFTESLREDDKIEISCTKGGDVYLGFNGQGRFMPGSAPTSADDLATKAQAKDWPLAGFKYSKVTEKGGDASGYFVRGTIAIENSEEEQKAEKKPEYSDKEGLGVLMAKPLSGDTLICYGRELTDDASVKAAIELCKSAEL